MAEPGVFTPYSSVAPLFDLAQDFNWVPELDQDRIQAYTAYDEIYWNYDQVFSLVMRGEFDKPVYIPAPRQIVDETAHYLLKDLNIAPTEGDDPNSALAQALKAFLEREQFYSRFHTAKHSGVARGDWVMHMTADEDKAEGHRISLVSVDPSSYFPIYDDDDVDTIKAVRLVEQIMKEDGSGTFVKLLQYTYETVGTPGALSRIVIREEVHLEVEGWFKGKAERKVIKRVLKPEPLDERITRIPVYHFKNMGWQGDPYGSSELRGVERLVGAINQSVSDEELTLALDGLGVYATDAPSPTDSEGKEVNWEIFPGVVLEVPGGNTFNRVGGVRTVKPLQDHIEFLQKALYEGTATFRSNAIDVQLAESGIALAIKFMPTAAKIEQRDLLGVDLLQHLFFEWKIWHEVFEGGSFSDEEIAVTLGDKLPINHTQVLNELNNMFDRKIISAKYYREEIARRLGYVFPDDIANQVLDEQKKLNELKIQLNPAAEDENQSNNRERPNESAGTEAGDGERP